jgi:cell wall-associated NlpC family hydrolase
LTSDENPATNKVFMKKFTIIFAVALLIESFGIMEAQAARTSPRPWLARDAKAKAVSMEARQPRKRVVRAKAARRVVSSRTDLDDKGEKIADQAKRYKGVRYRFGGDSKSKGFDCSGLVRRVYNDLSLKKLPRTSSQLFTMGDPVGLNELRAGDLVFFKNTYKRGISHVGVYAGNNKFIHAQNRRRGVTATSLADPYYQLHYAGARRLY